MAAGADLLEEHLGEIRNLRQRLEESICVNDRLREQLQHRLSSTARESGRRGPASVPMEATVPKAELHSFLSPPMFFPALDCHSIVGCV